MPECLLLDPVTRNFETLCLCSLPIKRWLLKELPPSQSAQSPFLLPILYYANLCSIINQVWMRAMSLQLCFALLFGLCLLVSQGITNPLDRLVPSRLHDRRVLIGTSRPTRDLHALEATKHVYKRTTITDLYYGARNGPNSQNYVPVGKSTYWDLDPSKAAVFTTSEFYGCTVVIVVSGKNVIIGHYGESSGGCVAMTDQA